MKLHKRMSLRRVRIQPPAQVRRPWEIYHLDALKLWGSPWVIIYRHAWTASGRLTPWYRQWLSRRNYKSKRSDVKASGTVFAQRARR